MEQRPQRMGYSDLNERQEEGVPALESDEREGRGTQLPDLGPGRDSGSDTDLTRRAWTNEGRSDPYTGSGQSELAADADDVASGQGDRSQDYTATSDASQGLGSGQRGAGQGGAAQGGARNTGLGTSSTGLGDNTGGDANDLSADVNEGGADSGGQRSGGDGGQSSATGG